MSMFMRKIGRGRCVAVVAVSALSVGAGAACTHPGHRPPPHPTTTVTSPPTGGRPVAIVEGGSRTLRLTGFGCWTDGLCIDPAPFDAPIDWPDVGTADAVTVTVTLDRLGGQFLRLADKTWVPAELTPLGPGRWRVTPPASPGTYVAALSANDARGDLTYVFRWTVA